MSKISRYASLVKFSHTIFAMPFALTAYVFALQNSQTPFEWLLLVKILLCMVFARNTAMGFNRWADRDIDSKNPRTVSRDIPAGRITAKSALRFVIINAVLMLICAFWINPLAGWLSPVALIILIGYSYTKRLTAWCHLVLGVALGIAPVGAYIAVTGTISFFSLILAGAVITWTAGFDILYAMQDADFDRRHNLKSIPAKYSPATSAIISAGLHMITLYAVAVIGKLYLLGNLYWVGASLFCILLIMQHILYIPSRVDRIGATFGLVNGLASVTYAAFTILDILL